MANSLKELEGILNLQQENLKRNLSSIEEANNEGFVTAEYDIEFLKMMHDGTPAVIAKDDDDDALVGYALVASKDIKGLHKLLDGLFKAVDSLEFNSIRLIEVEYILCGQLCVKKGYRNQGIAKRLYHYFRECYKDKYDYVITDVSTENQRSLFAHQKVGFEIINTFNYCSDEWHIVLWDWNNQKFENNELAKNLKNEICISEDINSIT